LKKYFIWKLDHEEKNLRGNLAAEIEAHQVRRWSFNMHQDTFALSECGQVASKMNVVLFCSDNPRMLIPSVKRTKLQNPASL